MRAAVLTLALLSSLAVPPGARADGPAVVHVVRPGETLASIAQLYYGDPRRESVLVAENGLTAQGGAPIVVGLRLLIPFVGYHRVQEGETWQELATRFYGEVRAVHVLLEANNGVPGEQPDVGAELLVPYPLRHVAAQGDTLMRISQIYYGNQEDARRLRRFNGFRTMRLTRGQIVLVPLTDLTLSEQGRALVEQMTGTAPPAGEVRAMQEHIDEQLPELREHVSEGRYTEAVALANRLLGTGELTGNQMVTIQRELGTAFVALDREDLAIEAFRIALARQPDLELDRTRTSPTVLRAFTHARTLHESEVAAQAARDGGTGDGGPPDAGPD